MAIALVGTPTTAHGTGAHNVTISYPTGHASGHVAFILVVTGSAETLSGTKTWTTLGNGVSAGGFEPYLISRVLDGTEGTTETISALTHNVESVEMRLYSGVNTSTPLDTAASNPQFTHASSTGPNAAGFTTVQDGDELIFMVVNYDANATSYTVPTGFGNTLSGFFSTSPAESVGGWDKAQASHGATGAVSTTAGVTGNWATVLFAIQPAATVVLGRAYGHYRKRITVPVVRQSRRSRHLWYPIGMPFVHVARKNQRLKVFPRIKAIKPRPEVHRPYPIGMPFVHVARKNARLTIFRRSKAIKPRQAVRRPYPIGMPFVHVARLGRRLRVFARIKAIKPRPAVHRPYPTGMPFIRIARRNLRLKIFPRIRAIKPRQFVRRPYPIGMPFVRIARLGSRLTIFRRIKAIKPRSFVHRPYPIGMPFVHIARFGSRLRVFPRIKAIIPRPARHIRQFVAATVFVAAIRAKRFRVRARIPRILRRAFVHRPYPIGMPFIHVAQKNDRFKIFPRIKAIKPLPSVRRPYPIGMPFVRIAKAGAHYIRRRLPKAIKPRPEVRRPYPIGMPFVRIARLGRRFRVFARIPRVLRREAVHRPYPIGMPFIRIARLGKRLRVFSRIKTIKPRSSVHRPYPIGMPFVRIARTVTSGLRVTLRRPVKALRRNIRPPVRYTLIAPALNPRVVRSSQRRIPVKARRLIKRYGARRIIFSGEFFQIPFGIPSILLVASAAPTLSFTAKLPLAQGTGDWIVVVKADANASAVVVAPLGTDLIDGVNSPDSLTTQWQAIRYVDYQVGRWLKW